MRFKVGGTLAYEVLEPSTFIINIHALHTPAQTLVEERFTVDPAHHIEELSAAHGESRFIRLDAQQPGMLNITYSALAETSVKLIPADQLVSVQLMGMDTSVIPYLYPSRYCQSDKLYRFAHNHFGHIDSAFEKVLAITDWIHDHVEYLSGSTNSQTSAYDTVTELAGVCRDFAHLGIALCRALDIPARYFTGYAYQLNPPDFHACFEAYLGGNWIIFDPTHLVPLNGLVKIATGRDAADASIATMFGRVNGLSVTASCELADEGFEPIYYVDGQLSGLSYL